jgi:hypothetical protein
MIDVTRIPPTEPEPMFEEAWADMRQWYLDAGEPNGRTLEGFCGWLVRECTDPVERLRLHTFAIEYCVGVALWETTT